MLRHTILLIDDDQGVLDGIGGVLEREGFTVLRAPNTTEGFRYAIDSVPDVILCDFAMPGEDGASFAVRLRSDLRTAAIPIILMSASQTTIKSQTEGIDAGADDYLLKPCDSGLMIAKVRAAVRRRVDKTLDRARSIGGIEFDPDGRRVLVRGHDARLTRREFDLFAALFLRPGKLHSIPYLLETVWAVDPAIKNDPATVHSHIASLRRKLGKEASERIKTVPGLGYRFDLDLSRS